jgi:hypothetical protein
MGLEVGPISYLLRAGFLRTRIRAANDYLVDDR